MNQDLLKQASKALSESGHDQQGGRYTRERLMASLHDRRRRSNTRFAVLLPMAAIFVGSTAFAAVTGRLETLMVSALDVMGLVPQTASWSGDAPAPASPRPAGGRRGAARPAASPGTDAPALPSAQPKPELELEAGPSTALQGGAGDEPPVIARGAREPRGVLEPQSSVRAGEPDNDAHEVYRRAHAAHFKNHDLSEALRGYEAYLAQQPSGRFAVDARYNRALCLVRLGRRAEAQAELERFARGSYGGYRQADAERLLAALNQEP